MLCTYKNVERNEDGPDTTEDAANANPVWMSNSQEPEPAYTDENDMPQEYPLPGKEGIEPASS